MSEKVLGGLQALLSRIKSGYVLPPGEARSTPKAVLEKLATYYCAKWVVSAQRYDLSFWASGQLEHRSKAFEEEYIQEFLSDTVVKGIIGKGNNDKALHDELHKYWNDLKDSWKTGARFVVVSGIRAPGYQDIELSPAAGRIGSVQDRPQPKRRRSASFSKVQDTQQDDLEQNGGDAKRSKLSSDPARTARGNHPKLQHTTTHTDDVFPQVQQSIEEDDADPSWTMELELHHSSSSQPVLCPLKWVSAQDMANPASSVDWKLLCHVTRQLFELPAKSGELKFAVQTSNGQDTVITYRGLTEALNNHFRSSSDPLSLRVLYEWPRPLAYSPKPTTQGPQLFTVASGVAMNTTAGRAISTFTSPSARHTARLPSAEDGFSGAECQDNAPALGEASNDCGVTAEIRTHDPNPGGDASVFSDGESAGHEGIAADKTATGDGHRVRYYKEQGATECVGVSPDQFAIGTTAVPQPTYGHISPGDPSLDPSATIDRGGGDGSERPIDIDHLPGDPAGMLRDTTMHDVSDEHSDNNDLHCSAEDADNETHHSLEDDYDTHINHWNTDDQSDCSSQDTTIHDVDDEHHEDEVLEAPFGNDDGDDPQQRLQSVTEASIEHAGVAGVDAIVTDGVNALAQGYVEDSLRDMEGIAMEDDEDEVNEAISAERAAQIAVTECFNSMTGVPPLEVGDITKMCEFFQLKVQDWSPSRTFNLVGVRARTDSFTAGGVSGLQMFVAYMSIKHRRDYEIDNKDGIQSAMGMVNGMAPGLGKTRTMLLEYIINLEMCINDRDIEADRELSKATRNAGLDLPGTRHLLDGEDGECGLDLKDRLLFPCRCNANGVSASMPVVQDAFAMITMPVNLVPCHREFNTVVDTDLLEELTQHHQDLGGPSFYIAHADGGKASMGSSFGVRALPRGKDSTYQDWREANEDCSDHQFALDLVSRRLRPDDPTRLASPERSPLPPSCNIFIVSTPNSWEKHVGAVLARCRRVSVPQVIEAGGQFPCDGHDGGTCWRVGRVMKHSAASHKVPEPSTELSFALGMVYLDEFHEYSSLDTACLMSINNLNIEQRQALPVSGTPFKKSMLDPMNLHSLQFSGLKLIDDGPQKFTSPWRNGCRELNEHKAEWKRAINAMRKAAKSRSSDSRNNGLQGFIEATEEAMRSIASDLAAKNRTFIEPYLQHVLSVQADHVHDGKPLVPIPTRHYKDVILKADEHEVALLDKLYQTLEDRRSSLKRAQVATRHALKVETNAQQSKHDGGQPAERTVEQRAKGGRDRAQRILTCSLTFPALGSLLEKIGREDLVLSRTLVECGFWKTPELCPLYNHLDELYNSSPIAKYVVRRIKELPRERFAVPEWCHNAGQSGKSQRRQEKLTVFAESALLIWIMLNIVKFAQHPEVVAIRKVRSTKGCDRGYGVIAPGMQNKAKSEMIDRVEERVALGRPYDPVDVLFCCSRVAQMSITLVKPRNSIRIDADWDAARSMQVDGRSYRVGQQRESYIYQCILTYRGLHASIIQLRTARSNMVAGYRANKEAAGDEKNGEDGKDGKDA